MDQNKTDSYFEYDKQDSNNYDDDTNDDDVDESNLKKPHNNDMTADDFVTSTLNTGINFKVRHTYYIPDDDSFEIDIFGQQLTTTDYG